MKKNIIKLFTLLLCAITCLLSVVAVYAETAPQTLKAQSHRYDITIINHPDDYILLPKTVDGKTVFCIYYEKIGPKSHVVYTKGEVITDNGMNYILNKAYGITNNDEIFIYKTALQQYMVDKGIMPGSYKTLTEFNEMLKKDNSAVATRIKSIIQEAKKAGANNNSAPTISVNTGTNTFKLDSTGKYYISNEVTVNSSTGAYEVSLTNAPAGSTVTKNANKFTVKVPADKVTNLETSISFKVTNTKDVYTSYKYNPSDSSYQTLAATYKETKTASATGNLLLKRTVSVPFLKIDTATGAAISGAELKLTNSKGKVIKTWTSTTEAITVSGLVEGTYTLTETKAPEGYKAIETSVKFSIDKQGNILDANNKKITQVVIKNERKTGGVSISKQDITNKEELPGATLVVKDYNGNVIEEWVSTNEPHYIEKLTPGIYTLTETIAPEGYILSTETITFTVKDDGTITKVVMYNSPAAKEEVPVEPTSSFKTMTSGIIGTIIVIAGSYIIFKSSKKKEVL